MVFQFFEIVFSYVSIRFASVFMNDFVDTRLSCVEVNCERLCCLCVLWGGDFVQCISAQRQRDRQFFVLRHVGSAACHFGCRCGSRTV